MAALDDLAYASVREVGHLLRSRALSVEELAAAFLARIDAIDGTINAWVTVDRGKVLEDARRLDRAGVSSETPLFGVPTAIKDLTPTAGLRTTFGSTFFSDFVPTTDAVIVERLRRAGALILGKTNTPEFGVGASTFNRVSGLTRNPWDPTKTVAGSSGGSAAALAAGMCTIAEGSDFGGSLRTPAAYCSVLGFRTSPGLVPNVPAALPWDSISVTGPMARGVDDLEAMLNVVAGSHPAAPLSIGWSDVPRRVSLGASPRLGFSTGRDLIDVTAEVLESLSDAMAAFAASGCQVDEVAPDLAPLKPTIRTIRAARAAALYGGYHDAARDRLAENIVVDVEEGRRISAVALVETEIVRGNVLGAAAAFWDGFDAFVLPAVPMRPFAADLNAPTEAGAETLRSYSDWFVLTHVVSLTGWPALALPSTPTADGLPLGIQLIGPSGSEWNLLELARRYEAIMGWGRRYPPPRLPA